MSERVLSEGYEVVKIQARIIEQIDLASVLSVVAVLLANEVLRPFSSTLPLLFLSKYVVKDDLSFG